MPVTHGGLWGMTFASELALPGARPGDGPAGVTIRHGEAAPLSDVRAEGVAYQAGPGAFRVAVPGVASFLVRGGAEIVVAPEPAAHADTVRLLLMGTPMGALLHQRERIPLHASAVEVDGAALLLAGHSSNGKSAIAAAFHELGHPVIADDICAVHARDDGSVVAEIGPSELLVWFDTLQQLGLEPADHERCRPELEKYRLPVATAAGPAEVARIYLLGRHNRDHVDVQPVEGLDRVRAILRQTRGSGYLEGMGAEPTHFRTATAIARQVPMFRVSLPRMGGVRAACDAIAAHLGAPAEVGA